jgi:cobalamin biosynthesis protein CobW
MEKLLEREDKPDHIVIETSGLALPQPLVRAFNWPGISTKVTVDGVVTVVDGKAVTEGRFAHNVAAVDAQRKLDENLDHETPLSELFEDQIACADMIVVNKTDLLSDDEVTALTAKLKDESRGGVQVVKTSMGALPVDVLLGQGIGAETDMAARHEVHHHHHHDDDHDDDHHHHHHDHDHDDFESFVVTLGEVDDPKAFTAKVVDVINAHDILRLKGFIAVAGKPMRLTLQAVGPRTDTYFDQPFTGKRETRLVVIGQAGLDRAAIEAQLVA